MKSHDTPWGCTAILETQRQFVNSFLVSSCFRRLYLRTAIFVCNMNMATIIIPVATLQSPVISTYSNYLQHRVKRMSQWPVSGTSSWCIPTCTSKPAFVTCYWYQKWTGTSDRYQLVLRQRMFYFRTGSRWQTTPVIGQLFVDIGWGQVRSKPKG